MPWNMYDDRTLLGRYHKMNEQLSTILGNVRVIHGIERDSVHLWSKVRKKSSSIHGDTVLPLGDAVTRRTGGTLYIVQVLSVTHAEYIEHTYHLRV